MRNIAHNQCVHVEGQTHQRYCRRNNHRSECKHHREPSFRLFASGKPSAYISFCLYLAGHRQFCRRLYRSVQMWFELIRHTFHSRRRWFNVTICQGALVTLQILIYCCSKFDFSKEIVLKHVLYEKILRLYLVMHIAKNCRLWQVFEKAR